MASDRPPTELERLERAAAELRPIERTVLVLSAREGLGNREIADRLGIRPSRVERLLARAICRLDRALDREKQPWWRFR